MTRTTPFTLASAALLISSSSQGAVLYVDAVLDPSQGTVNTTLADGTPVAAGTDYELVPGSVPAANNTDNKWDVRSTFANGGTIVSAGNGGDRGNAPVLRVTVPGLTPGALYSTYAFFWDASGSNSWRGRANNTGATDLSGNLIGNYFADYNPASAPDLPFTELTFDADPDNPGPITTDDGANENGGYFSNTVLVRESDRYMLQAELGVSVANASGEVYIYVDDGPSRNIDRTWFDGVGVELIPEPSSVTLVVLGLLGLAGGIRKRLG